MHTLAKILFWGIILLAGSNAQAQNTASASAKVTLTVVKGLNVRSSANLRFNQNKDHNGVSIITPKEKKAGHFIIEGKPGSHIMVSLPNTITLWGRMGNNVRMISNQSAYNTNNIQRSSKLVSRSNQISTYLNDKGGKLYVWFGGKINYNRVSPGNYDGEYTTTITYLDQ